MCKFRPIFSILFSFGLPYSFSALTQLGDKKGIDLKKNLASAIITGFFFGGGGLFGRFSGTRPNLNWTPETGRLTR